MLDIRRIVDDKAAVEEALLKRMPKEELDLDDVITGYENLRTARQKFEELRAEQNAQNDKMAKLDKRSEEFTNAVEKMRKLSEDVRERESTMGDIEQMLVNKLSALPNLPDDDVPSGGKENNKVLREEGKVPEFDFDIKDHLTLGTELGILDFERASKMAGAQFAMHVGDGTMLIWALVTYFMKQHVKDGYTPYLPPHLLNRTSAFVAGQLPKFEDDVYWTNDDMCLLPTAETALSNLHRDEILDEKSLPEKFFAYTPCYRKESGSYGSRDKGLMRMHQFHKVEMFQYTKPEDSDTAMDELVRKAEELVKSLGLAYRVTLLAAEDMSFGMAKTIDIEAWLPYEKKWAEVSSISNSRDFQARRGNVRYRKSDGSLDHVHMLNASGLATSRLMVALLETYQQADGSVKIPKVLQDFMGKSEIKAN